MAEESGLICELGRIVLVDACEALAGWLNGRNDRPLTVSVNVSARQLSDPHFPTTVCDVVDRTGIPPALLCLEVTETALIEADKAIDTLRELKAIGVQIAIDDFGTGYSSLARLRSFPLDFLKIDRTFVDGMTEQPEDAVIVSAVLSLAAELGLQTVAEGIEDEEQLRQLAAKGCDIGQGYLWSPPVPLEVASAMAAAVAPLHHNASE